MKTILRNYAVVTGLFITSVSSVFAQKSGVFKTYADYSSGKMEYGIDCAKESHKIKLNDFLGKDYITVIHEGKPYDLKKADTWGYQLCDEKVIRFQVKDHFPLEDKGILCVYTKESVTHVSLRGSAQMVTNYYFSKGGGGEIKEMTLLNLKAAVPDNHMLHDSIDAHFKNDTSLEEYDQFHKHYKINHFLESQGIK